MRRRAAVYVLGAAVVWVVSGTAIVATSGGCYGRECDPGPVIHFATKHTEPDGARVDGTFCGEFLAPDYWESSPVDADWIDFPPKNAFIVIIPTWGTNPVVGEARPFIEMHAYVSEQRRPVCHDDAGGCVVTNNFTEGTGNVVEFSRVDPGLVWITNDTCSHFYLRVVLRAGAPTQVPTNDAGPFVRGPLGPPVASCETP